MINHLWIQILILSTPIKNLAFVALLMTFALEAQANRVCIEDLSRPTGHNLRQVCNDGDRQGAAWGSFLNGANRTTCLRVIVNYLGTKRGMDDMDALRDVLPSGTQPFINLVVDGRRGSYDALSLRVMAGDKTFNFPASACDVNAAVASATSQVRMGTPSLLVPRDRGSLDTRDPASNGTE